MKTLSKTMFTILVMVFTFQSQNLLAQKFIEDEIVIQGIVYQYITEDINKDNDNSWDSLSPYFEDLSKF